MEHDVAAQGTTIESAVDTLIKIACAHIAYDRRHHREPLSAFAPAPRLYWTAFKRAKRLPTPLELDGCEAAAPVQIVAAVLPENPAVRPLPPVARTA